MDERPEALEYDKFALGIYNLYNENEGREKKLVGHVPVELSSLIYHFLNASSENKFTVEVTGKTKREV